MGTVRRACSCHSHEGLAEVGIAGHGNWQRNGEDGDTMMNLNGSCKNGRHDTDLIPRDVLLERQALDGMRRHARLAAYRMFDTSTGLDGGIMLPYATVTGDADTLDMLGGQIDTLRMIYGLGSIDLIIGDTTDDAFSDYEEMLASLTLGVCGVGMLGTTMYERDGLNRDESGDGGWVWVETGTDATRRYASCDEMVADVERRIDECMTQLVPCEAGDDTSTKGYAEIDGRFVEMPESVTKAARALCECRQAQPDVVTMDRDGICDLLKGIATRLLTLRKSLGLAQG